MARTRTLTPTLTPGSQLPSLTGCRGSYWRDLPNLLLEEQDSWRRWLKKGLEDAGAVRIHYSETPTNPRAAVWSCVYWLLPKGTQKKDM